MWVKICGITNLQDALAAAQAGADALGFVFVPASPRAMTRDRVSEILMAVPSPVMTVGVVANENPDFLRGLLRVCPLRSLQFHGEEPPEDLLALKGEAKLIKAIRVKDAGSLEQIPRYRGVDAILLDAYHPQLQGETGSSFSAPLRFVAGGGHWKLAAQAKSFGIPVVVAGGLTPENVEQAVREVEPYGVDVSSGVEVSPGRKDHDFIRKFIRNAKSFHSE